MWGLVCGTSGEGPCPLVGVNLGMCVSALSCSLEGHSQNTPPFAVWTQSCWVSGPREWSTCCHLTEGDRVPSPVKMRGRLKRALKSV